MLTKIKGINYRGLGFIGSNLARTLLGHGAEVTLVDSLIPSTGAIHSILRISEVR